MDELLKEIETALEVTKDFSKFRHIFSDDDGERTLAKLRKTIQKIKTKALLSGVKEITHPDGKPLRQTCDSGKLVSVRPCEEKYEDKTFLGILIGDAALSSVIKIKEDAILCNWSFFNPAILLVESGDIVYGCNSWWSSINSEDDLKKISDLDIESTWYVRALKQLEGKDHE